MDVVAFDDMPPMGKERSPCGAGRDRRVWRFAGIMIPHPREAALTLELALGELRLGFAHLPADVIEHDLHHFVRIIGDLHQGFVAW